MWGSYAQFLKFRVISTISQNLNLYMYLNDYMNNLHYIYRSYYTVFNINNEIFNKIHCAYRYQNSGIVYAIY